MRQYSITIDIIREVGASELTLLVSALVSLLAADGAEGSEPGEFVGNLAPFRVDSRRTHLGQHQVMTLNILTPLPKALILEIWTLFPEFGDLFFNEPRRIHDRQGLFFNFYLSRIIDIHRALPRGGRRLLSEISFRLIFGYLAVQFLINNFAQLAVNIHLALHISL
jgi:hypothetical protein